MDVRTMIGLVDNDVLPIKREITAYELECIKELAEENEKSAAEILLLAIDNAYKFGFCLGWKHCEIEHQDF